MIFKPISILLITLLTTTSLFAQNRSSFFNNATVGFQGHYGSFIATVPKAEYLKDSYTHFGELTFSKPIPRLGTPPDDITRWGCSIFYGNTGSRQFIGNMAGIFPYVDFRLFGGHRFTSSFRTGMGAGWIQKPYDIETNHKNILLGSHVNIFVNLMWKNELRLSEKVKINAGLSFSHLSNASLKLPNLGINTPALSAGISYTFSNPVIQLYRRKDTLDTKVHFKARVSIGMKQTPWIESDRYGTVTGELEILKHHRQSFNYGAGIAIFYDPSLPHFYIDPIITIGEPYKHTVNIGPYFMYEKIVGRLSIPLQLGVYAIDDYLGLLYQNIGFRYQLNRHWAAGGYLKTHWGKADFIHTGIDYNF